MDLPDHYQNTGCDEGVDAISSPIQREAVRETVRGIDVLASVAADLDLDSTPRSEVADGGSSDLFSGDMRTSETDGAVPAHIQSEKCGWKRRNQTGERLTARATPSKITSIERCLLESEGKHGPDTFAPVVGTSFDSCQEAYEQYNLFAWENGFGIRHGKSRWGEGRYQLMHEIVCQCQGKADKENSVSCKTQCKEPSPYSTYSERDTKRNELY